MHRDYVTTAPFKLGHLYKGEGPLPDWLSAVVGGIPALPWVVVPLPDGETEEYADVGHGWAVGFDVTPEFTHGGATFTATSLILNPAHGHELYAVNESPYAAGGGQDWCIFGASQSAIEAFVRDFGVTAEVEHQAMVRCTV